MHAARPYLGRRRLRAALTPTLVPVPPRRYCKLRLDRVLKGELSGSLADVTASKGPVPPFAKPASWTAPYNKYAQGWWDMFMNKE